MKTQRIIILLVLLPFLISCENDEILPIDEGISFRQYKPESDGKSFSVVQYDEILGYDSTKYAFELNESAWKRIEKEVGPVVPDPNFGFFVAINNEFIYAAAYIQPYSSFAQRDKITFRVKKPNFVFIELGYPAVPKTAFTGQDLRNSPRLIEQLEKDNKIIEIEE